MFVEEDAPWPPTEGSRPYRVLREGDRVIAPPMCLAELLQAEGVDVWSWALTTVSLGARPQTLAVEQVIGLAGSQHGRFVREETAASIEWFEALAETYARPGGFARDAHEERAQIAEAARAAAERLRAELAAAAEG